MFWLKLLAAWVLVDLVLLLGLIGLASYYGWRARQPVRAFRNELKRWDGRI
jgi:hypothetical protein